MTPFKTVLVASALLAGGMLPAAAQSTAPNAAGVSAATHCKDAQGNVKLKTAANNMGTPTPSGNTKGNGTDRPMSGSGTTGSGSATGSNSGTMSGSAAAAANLQPCR